MTCAHCSNTNRFTLFFNPVTETATCINTLACESRKFDAEVRFGLEYRAMLRRRHGYKATLWILEAELKTAA